MKITLNKWIRIYYTKLTESIAFYPALIAFGFLILSWVMISIDFSDGGKELKSNLSWLSLKDASTARSIISTVAGAIISLTVFSFSMVMIVLNQAASQMSNRVLSSMIENRFQQVILGFYIGTIVYALFLLSTIRDISSGVYVPALSVYLLILLTVIDIFLFIYFLDYVTQTVKYETVIDRVSKQTMHTMKKIFEKNKINKIPWITLSYMEINTQRSDYFQGFNEQKLLQIACRDDLYITFLYKPSTYLLKDKSCIRVYSKELVHKEAVDEITATTDFHSGQPIDKVAEYGFRQLTEIAIKALSPGINDPGTAVIALNSLTALLAYKINHTLPELRMDNHDVARIFVPSASFHEMFKTCILPIWKYGKEDQYIQEGLTNTIAMLKDYDNEEKYSDLFLSLLAKIDKQKEKDLG